MTILVLGASGFIGGALMPALYDAGESVRAASRRTPARLPTGAKWVHANLEDPSTLPAALDGIETAYYLVHSMGRERPDFRDVDRRCAENFARAAADSGCKRIIYLGGVAPRGERSEHLASRLEVGEILRGGRVPALELRAGMIIGNGSASWRVVRDLATRLPFMVLPKWLDSKSCPIALSDVIAALLAARSVPLDASAWFDIPGPQALSGREMLMRVAALLGRRVPSIRVPVLTPRLSAMWLRLVSGADYSIARELVMGLTGDLLPQRSFWRVAGLRPRMSFDAAAAAALASERPSSGAARTIERLVQRFGPHVAT